MKMKKIGLIGLGYWGPNLARVLSQSTHCEFVACCDQDPQKLNKTLKLYPTLRGYTSVDELLASDVDAVVIATNISTHHNLARRALRAGKHVMVEKPLADSTAKAEDLVAEAEKANLRLMVGHTFIYSPAVVKVKELIDSGEVGDIRYLSFSRVNLGLFQKDVDVVWDLAVHDISILLYWLGDSPAHASCFGRACVQEAKYDVAFLWFQFAGGPVASCEVSWLSPQKMRRTCVVGSKRMIVYDDTDPSEKIRIYDRGVTLHEPKTFGEFQLTYRIGDMTSPSLTNSEPLLTEVEHFVHCVETGETPRTDGKFGADVVRVIEMATATKWVPDQLIIAA